MRCTIIASVDEYTFLWHTIDLAESSFRRFYCHILKPFEVTLILTSHSLRNIRLNSFLILKSWRESSKNFWKYWLLLIYRKTSHLWHLLSLNDLKIIFLSTIALIMRMATFASIRCEISEVIRLFCMKISLKKIAIDRMYLC